MTTVEVGDLVTAELLDLMLNPPFCRLLQASAQSLPNATNTSITFGAGSEDVDTDNFHDETTNPSRVTPTIAGWYEAKGTVVLAGNANTNDLLAFITKNGTTLASSNREKYAAAGGANANSSHATAIVETYCNGTTDYIEIQGRHSDQAAAARSTSVAGSVTSSLSVRFIRSEQA